jgi:hypothetical protein
MIADIEILLHEISFQSGIRVAVIAIGIIKAV